MGLCRFAGRELEAGDFGFRGRRVGVLKSIGEAYRNQHLKANA